LTDLETFDFYMNGIGGTIPTIIDQLTALKTFDVEENMFTGPAFVPVSDTVESYRVSLNDLTGTIPDLSNLGDLRELWFAGNTISAGLPTTIGGNTNLASLILYDTGLTGTLPSELGLLDLEQFTAQRNSFTGTIPEELYENTRLEALRLDQNMLAGTLSTRLGDLIELLDLRLGENEFSGTLPPQIARLSNLRKSVG